MPARPRGALDTNLHHPGLLDYGLHLLEREADEAREDNARLAAIIKRLAGAGSAVRS